MSDNVKREAGRFDLQFTCEYCISIERRRIKLSSEKYILSLFLICFFFFFFLIICYQFLSLSFAFNASIEVTYLHKFVENAMLRIFYFEKVDFKRYVFQIEHLLSNPKKILFPRCCYSFSRHLVKVLIEKRPKGT